MKKPYNIEESLKTGENKKSFKIKFNDDTTHEEVSYQFITGLVGQGFAPEKEILEELLTMLKIELDKTN